MWSIRTCSRSSRAESARSSAGKGCASVSRPALREHDPHARHGRRSAGEFGRPETPMAMATVACALWQRVLRFNPENPIWPNCDRFVLSMGHASMLLHLTGVKAVESDYERLGELSVTLDDIKCFRQLDSKCPGHPEYCWTSGIETATGPLGQGVATSVGIGKAVRWVRRSAEGDKHELGQDLTPR